MAKMTLEDLKKLRDEKKKSMDRREVEGKDIEIIIGMATCGIAAGAKDTMSAFLTELDNQNMHNVVVRQTGCQVGCELRLHGISWVEVGKARSGRFLDLQEGVGTALLEIIQRMAIALEKLVELVRVQ